MLLLRIILFFCSVITLVAAAVAEPSALSRNHIDALTNKYSSVVDQAQSDQTIAGYLAIANQLAEKYSRPEFLDPILQPEKFQAQEQQRINNQLIASVSAQWIHESLNFGLYYGDLLRGGSLAASWALEWWLHKKISGLLSKLFAVQIVAQSQSVMTALEKNSSQPNAFIQPTIKSIIQSTLPFIAAYIIANNLLIAAQEHYLPASTQLPSEPKALSHLIPRNIMSVISAYGSPQTWTKTLNQMLKKLGLLPEWTEYQSSIIIKDTLLLLIWTAYFARMIIAPMIHTYTSKKRDQLTTLLSNVTDSKNQQEKDLGQQKLVAFMHQATELNLSTWLIFKTVQLSTLQTAAHLLMATPAWYRLGKFTYQTYKRVTG